MTDLQKFFSFSQQIAGKRVVIFGAGRSAAQFLAELPVVPEFFIDNDPKRAGEEFLGRPVRAFQALMDVPSEALFVVICTQDFEAVALQLSSLGLVPNKQFVEAPQFQINDQPECELLVSCIGDHGGIYRVNALTKQAEHVFQGDVRGLSVGKDSIVAVLEHEGLVRLDFDFKVVQRHPPVPKLDFHGIAHNAEENVYYVTETQFDRVGIYDGQTLERTGEFVLAGEPGSGRDAHHVNDTCFHRGELYVSMFSRQGVWRNEVWNDGTIVVLDPSSGRIKRTLITGLQQPHSIHFEGQHLWFCNSMNYAVHRGTTEACTFSGYTRGLAQFGKFMFVGQSKVRRLSRFSSRFNNISLDCGLHVWHKENKTSSFIPLAAGGVFDIVVLNQPSV